MQNPKQEVTLETIDFEWVAEQTKPQQLKKALKLLELDGNYYTELIKACEDQLAKIDPKFQKSDPAVVDPHIKQEAKIEVEEWVDQPKLHKNQKLAEIERTKGNEAIKSNDLQEALNYYTKSIQYDDRMAASYCNRALVYLKLKNYDNVVKDCNQAIQLQSDYLKAYHRRGKAYFAQQQYEKAYLDFKYIIEKEPTNDEVNGELRECRKHLTDQQINTAQNKQFIEKAGGFKKVQIVEEDDDDDGEEDEIPIQKTKQRLDFSKQIQQIQTKKNEISELIKRGQYSVSIEQISILLKENQLILDQQNEEELINVRASLLSNLAYCHLQLQEYSLVIEYCTLLIDLQPPRDILIKAYLRRALAYENLEKVSQSKFDFYVAKQIDHSNLQASQGMTRLSQIMTTKENEQFLKLKQEFDQQSQHIPQINQQQKQNLMNQQIIVEDKIQTTTISDAQLQKEMTQFKDAGNAAFKDGKHQDALDKWQAGIEFYEQNTLPSQEKLYLSLLTNSCLCLSKLNNYEQIIQLANKVIKIDPQNIKALYRRGLAQFEIGNQKTDLIEQNNFYELSRRDLEQVVHIDPKDKEAQIKLAQVQKINVECRVKIKKQKEEAPQSPQSQPQQQIIQEEQTNQQEKKQKTKPVSLQEQQIQQMGANLTQNVINDLLTKDQLPETASEFEKNMIAFKKASSDQIINYIFKVSNLPQLYSNKDLPFEVLLQLMKASIDQIQYEDIQAKLKEILQNRFPQTNKFHLCVMQLAKKEKQQLREILTQLSLNDLFIVYKV